MIQNATSKTNKQFMILSAFGIIFVVDAHAWGGIGLMVNIFPYNSFFIPMFCFISGYFFNPEKANNLVRYLLHKVHTLLMPFFVWNFIYGILITLLRHTNLVFYGSDLSIKTLFILPFFEGSLFEINSPAWFVPALFMVIFTYAVLYKIMFRGFSAFIVTFILAIAGASCIFLSRKGYNNSLLLPVLKTGFLLQFYHLGSYYHMHLEKYFHRIHKCITLLLPILINVWLMYIYNNQIHFNDITTMSGFLTDNYWLPLVTSLTGICFWLSISDIMIPILENNPVINYISSNTFTIMMHHILFFNIYNLILAVLTQFLIIYIPFDIMAFQSTAWYRFEPVSACRFIYLIFGVGGPLICKFYVENSTIYKKIYYKKRSY